MDSNEVRAVLSDDDLRKMPVGKMVEADGVVYRKVRRRKGNLWRVMEERTSSQLFRFSSTITTHVEPKEGGDE